MPWGWAAEWLYLLPKEFLRDSEVRSKFFLHESKAKITVGENIAARKMPQRDQRRSVAPTD